MTAVNRWVAAHIVHESATQNEDGERIGLINRVFVGARGDRDQPVDGRDGRRWVIRESAWLRSFSTGSWGDAWTEITYAQDP